MKEREYTERAKSREASGGKREVEMLVLEFEVERPKQRSSGEEMERSCGI